MLWERPQARFTSAKDVMSLTKTWLKETLGFKIQFYTVIHNFLYSNEEKQEALELMEKKHPEKNKKQTKKQ